MEIYQETKYFLENSKNKFRIKAKNEELEQIEIYSGGDYSLLNNLSKGKLEQIITVLISEHLKLSCGYYLENEGLNES